MLGLPSLARPQRSVCSKVWSGRVHGHCTSVQRWRARPKLNNFLRRAILMHTARTAFPTDDWDQGWHRDTPDNKESNTVHQVQGEATARRAGSFRPGVGAEGYGVRRVHALTRGADARALGRMGTWPHSQNQNAPRSDHTHGLFDQRRSSQRGN